MRWIANKTFVDNFDSVTLYGNDPHIRPDIYGKIGNAGVSICLSR
jgi:methylmalonyl-CoA mutase N-terminal domain/subunit